MVIYMKKELLIASLLGILGLVGIGVILFKKPTPPPALPKTTPIPSQAQTTIKISDVAMHAKETDCWVIVNDKVYNITSYLPNHPGGPDKIIPLCGKDATSAFNTRGGQGPHSPKAEQTLQSYYVGNL